MPRKKANLATTFAEKKAKRFKAKMKKERALLVSAIRSENRAKRMISSGMLLPSPSATPRRTRKAGAVSVKVGKRKTTTRKAGVTRGCSTAGRELVKKKTTRAGKYLVTKCKTGKSVTATTKRKTTKSSAPKSAVKKVRVGAGKGASLPNPLKAVSKVVKSILGGGTKKRSTTATKKRTTTKKVSRAASSKIARIKRIVC
jgi:hypothetical protein